MHNLLFEIRGDVMLGDAMALWGDVTSTHLGDVMSGDVMSGDIMSGDVMSGDVMSLHPLLQFENYLAILITNL